MKIAIVAIGGFDRSGTDRIIPCLLWLIEQLTESGDEVHVFVPRQEDTPGTWSLLGATVHNAGRGFWPLRTLMSIAREHRKAQFEIIHAFWTSMGTVGALASKLLNVPMVLTLPGGDAVGIPQIGYGAMLSVRGRAMLQIAAGAASRTTVPSDYMRQLAVARGIEATIVPLGADTRRSPPAPPRPRDVSKALKVVHVASLNRVKDQPTLLHAFRILRSRGIPFEARIIGFDTLAGETRRLASELSLGEQVTFLDAVSYDVVRAHYEWADILVMASLHEAGPLVMLEAALAGVPTVGTRVGHMADHSPRAAVAVPVSDPVALADAISAIAADEARRISLAQAAQAFSVEHDATFTARTFKQIYRQVCGQ